jgi:hypothetical protein
MLRPERYAALKEAIEARGARAVVSAEAYRRCHYLLGWYAHCQNLTPKTIFLSKDDDLSRALAATGWHAYFVKDYVKSLTTTRGSVARNDAEVSLGSHAARPNTLVARLTVEEYRKKILSVNLWLAAYSSSAKFTVLYHILLR